MNIYDYRTIPPEESAYHARNAHTADSDDEYGDGDIPKEDLANRSGDGEKPSDPDSADFGVHHTPRNVISDEEAYYDS